MTDSNYYVSTTSDVAISNDESQATLKSHDMVSSSNDPVANSSSDDNLNKAVVPYNENDAIIPIHDYLYEEIIKADDDDDDDDDDDVDDVVNANDEIVSLSSSVSSIDESKQSTDACSVVLCNNFVRSHFDTLFYINFPNNNISLKTKWWKICGRKDTFDPLSKICSIHFKADDFIIREQIRSGQRYRQTVLAYPGVIPTLYVQPHEYTKFIRKRKMNTTTNDNRKEASIKVTELPMCAVQSCKSTLSNNNIKKLFFKFPLKNKDLLEKWVNNIGLANWQPLETDRICSDHFENHDIINNNNKYNLNKNALPLIKPKNPYVMNSIENNCKIPKKFIKKRKKYEFNFDSDNIEFCKINDDVLVVKDIKNRDESGLLGSLENITKNGQQKKDENTPIQPKLTDGNDNNEIDVNENSNNIDFELVYLDILNDDNVVEIQPIEDANDTLQEKNSINENANNENIDTEYVYMEILENENVVEIKPTTNSKNVVKEEHKNKKLVDITRVSTFNDLSKTMKNSNVNAAKLMISKDASNNKKSDVFTSMSTGNTYVKCTSNMSRKSSINSAENNISKDEHKNTKPGVFARVSSVNNTPVKFSTNVLRKTQVKSTGKYFSKDEHENTKPGVFASVSTVNNTPVTFSSNVLRKTQVKSTGKYFSKDKGNMIKLANIPSTSTVNHTTINCKQNVLKKSQIKSTEQNIPIDAPNNKNSDVFSSMSTGNNTYVKCTSNMSQKSNINSAENIISKDEHKNTKPGVFTSFSTVNNTPVKFSSNVLRKTQVKSTGKDFSKDEHENTKPRDFEDFSVLYKNTPMLFSSNVLRKTQVKSTGKDFSKADIGNTTKLANIPSTSTVNHTTINSKPNVLKKSEIKSTEQNNPIETPRSIMFNKSLTETYGEMLPPYCTPGCKLLCYYCIPGPERREIFEEFYKFYNANEQNWKITQLVQLCKETKEDGSLKSCPVYSLIVDKESVTVCRTFFINTLGITDNRLDAVLIPFNYNWYSDRETLILANRPRYSTDEPIMTDFIRNSLPMLMKDYNLFEPESDEEVSLDNVPDTEYEKVINYIKSIPRVLSRYVDSKTKKSQCFETSIHVEYMFKTYSEMFIKNNTAPPYTRRQFKKIYNQYMKNFLRKV